MNRTLTTQMTFHLIPADSDADRTPVEVALEWDPTEPLWVTTRFLTGRTVNGQEPVWLVGRDLIAEGLIETAGEADILIEPGGEYGDLLMTFRSDSGHAEFAVDPEPLDLFLAETYARCPYGKEFAGVDFEAELQAIIENDPARVHGDPIEWGEEEWA